MKPSYILALVAMLAGSAGAAQGFKVITPTGSAAISAGYESGPAVRYARIIRQIRVGFTDGTYGREAARSYYETAKAIRADYRQLLTDDETANAEFDRLERRMAELTLADAGQ